MADRAGSKYQRLASNTLLFGLSRFGSSLLPFLMVPLYTRVFTHEQYGLRDLLTASANLIIPIISICIHEAVIRFGLEKGRRRSDVFTTSVLVILIGYGVLLLAHPLLAMVEHHQGYLIYIYLYTLAAALRSSVTHYVRAVGYVKLFAVDGVSTTLLTVVLNVIFLLPLDMGVAGFLLATIIADTFSALSLTLLLRLHKIFSIRYLRRETFWAMVRYSIPLMPTAVFWWVTNLSDRYLVTLLIDLEATGLYSAAGVVPRVITLVSTIFIQAWQISAFGEFETTRAERERFYTTVFRSYCTLVLVAASGLILLARPIMRILVAPDFYPAWIYLPFLVLSVAFSCLVTFLGTIYKAHKSNRMVGITTFIGAAANIGLNFLLIPVLGANGAALATFASFFLVFLIRAVDTRRFMRIGMDPVRMTFVLAVLLGQTFVTITQPEGWVFWSVGTFLLVVLLNLGRLLYMLKHAGSLLRRGKAH